MTMSESIERAVKVRLSRLINARVMSVLVLLPALAACGDLSETISGTAKRAPDEFTVVKRAPLVVPPDHNLRPPTPGAPRPQELQPSQTARGVLINSAGGVARSTARSDTTPSTAGQSPGEAAFLKRADTGSADPNIRKIIESETTALVEKDKNFTDRLIFWQEKRKPGEIIDAAKEARRIQENSATGKPVNAGTTPVIRHRKRGILEGIF